MSTNFKDDRYLVSLTQRVFWALKQGARIADERLNPGTFCETRDGEARMETKVLIEERLVILKNHVRECLCMHEWVEDVSSEGEWRAEYGPSSVHAIAQGMWLGDLEAEVERDTQCKGLSADPPRVFR